jgi:hypothetical protein
MRRGGEAQKAIAADAHGRLHFTIALGNTQCTTHLAIGSWPRMGSALAGIFAKQPPQTR